MKNGFPEKVFVGIGVGILVLLCGGIFIFAHSEAASQASSVGAQTAGQLPIVTQVELTSTHKVLSITGGQVVQRIVTSEDKSYFYLFVNPSKTGSINTTGVVQNQTLIGFNTNNIYWNAEPPGAGQTQGYSTVGEDSDTLNGVMDLWQYANVNFTFDGHSSPIYFTNNYNLPGLPPCRIDSQGQNRISVYMIIANNATRQTYTITGGELLGYKNQITFVIFVSGIQGGLPGFNSSCPAVSNPGASLFFDWFVRSPPSQNHISGNFGIFDTVGGQLTKTGTNALGFDQFINRTYQVSNSQVPHVYPALSASFLVPLVAVFITASIVFTALAIRKRKF